MATARDLEEHRPALTGHGYRMMASVADADDAVQETMVRAWRGLELFDGRASLRTWLYRIATRVCLDALAERTRRVHPMELGPPSSLDEPLTALLREDATPSTPPYQLWLRGRGHHWEVMYMDPKALEQ